MTDTPALRWGARATSDPTHDLQFLQDSYNDDHDFARRGELFIDEPLQEGYYVDLAGVARRLGDLSPVSFSRINFTGLREFANDAAAAAASPAVPVGGMYHTAGVLKVRRG